MMSKLLNNVVGLPLTHNNAENEHIKKYVSDVIYKYFCGKLDNYESVIDAAIDANEVVNEILRRFARRNDTIENIVENWIGEQI